MKKLLSTAMALAMAATSTIIVMPVSQAEAACRGRSCSPYSSTYKGERTQYRNGRHYNRHGRYYGHRHRYYRHGRYYYDDDYAGAAAAAGIMGLAIGAMAGAAASGGSHEARCAAKYRSYDPGSDTFMGYDGVRHRCRL